MKIVKFLKPTVDILMLADFIVLQSMKFTGGKFHEIFGLVLVFLMLVHLCLNMKMIVQSLKNFGKIKAKTKISLIIDILFMLVFMTCIVTGLLSSRFILSTNAPVIISVIHRYTGMAGLVICLIHLGFHLSPLFAKINKVYEKKRIAFLSECLIYCCMTFSLSVYAFRDVFYRDSNPEMKAKNAHEDSRMVDSFPEDDESSADYSSQTEEINPEENGDSQISKENSDIQKEEEQISPETHAEPEETLEEYLSKMYCIGCGRHCPLSAPQCGRGRSQQQKATEEYNQQYNTNETY